MSEPTNPNKLSDAGRQEIRDAFKQTRILNRVASTPAPEPKKTVEWLKALEQKRAKARRRVVDWFNAQQKEGTNE